MLFDFVIAGLWMLATNAGPGDIARKLVHIECDLEPLLAGHGAVTLNLYSQRFSRRHSRFPDWLAVATRVQNITADSLFVGHPGPHHVGESHTE